MSLFLPTFDHYVDLVIRERRPSICLCLGVSLREFRVSVWVKNKHLLQKNKIKLLGFIGTKHRNLALSLFLHFLSMYWAWCCLYGLHNLEISWVDIEQVIIRGHVIWKKNNNQSAKGLRKHHTHECVISCQRS